MVLTVQVIVDSINRTDLDLRKSLFGNIVLSGGSTLCTGFGDRLLSEVKKLALKDVKLKIYAPPERKVRYLALTFEMTQRDASAWVLMLVLICVVLDLDRWQYPSWTEHVQKGE